MNMTFPQLLWDLDVFYSQLNKEHEHEERELKKISRKYGRR